MKPKSLTELHTQGKWIQGLIIFIKSVLKTDYKRLRVVLFKSLNVIYKSLSLLELIQDTNTSKTHR